MAKVNFAIVNVLWVLGAGCYLQDFLRTEKVIALVLGKINCEIVFHSFLPAP